MVVWDSTEVHVDEEKGEIRLVSTHNINYAKHLLQGGQSLSKCIGAVSILFIQPEGYKTNDDFPPAETKKPCSVSLPASLSIMPSPTFVSTSGCSYQNCDVSLTQTLGCQLPQNCFEPSARQNVIGTCLDTKKLDKDTLDPAGPHSVLIEKKCKNVDETKLGTHSGIDKAGIEKKHEQTAIVSCTLEEQNSVLLCMCCSASLTNWQDLVEHAMQGHGNISRKGGGIVCPACEDVFDKNDTSRFVQHAKFHWGQCSDSGDISSDMHDGKLNDLINESNLGNIDHKINEHFMTLDSTYSNRKKFPRLNPRVSKSNSLKCDICKKSISSYSDILFHSKIHNMFLDCPVCRKEFTMRGGLLRHFVTHVDNRVFGCNTCGSVFTRKDNLKRHNLKGCQTLFLKQHKPKHSNNVNSTGSLKTKSGFLSMKSSLKYKQPKKFKSSSTILTAALKKSKAFLNIPNFKKDKVKINPGSSGKDPPDLLKQNILNSETTQFVEIGDVHVAENGDSSRNECIYSDSSSFENIPVAESSESSMNYACAGCNVTFCSSSALRKHVVLVHSEQPLSYHPAINTDLFKEDSISEGFSGSSIKTENDDMVEESTNAVENRSLTIKIEPEYGYENGFRSGENITASALPQEEEQNDHVMDIESLSMMAGMNDLKHVPSSSAWAEDSSVPGSSGYTKTPDICVYPLTSSPNISSQDVLSSVGNLLQQSACSTSSFTLNETAETSCIAPKKRKNILQDKAPICHFCGAFFDKAINIVHHTHKHMDMVSVKSTCTICLKELSGKDSFLRHANSHLGRMFPCEVCFQYFSRKDNLKRHRLKVHDLDGPIVDLPLLSDPDSL